MNLILELDFILKSNQPNDFNLLVPANSKIKLLYDLAIKHGVASDEEASNIIYNTKKVSKKYLMLKRSLIQKLLDLVFLQDNTKALGEHHENIAFQIEKELIISEKLLAKNVYHNASKLIAKAEQAAEKYFLTSLQLKAAKKMRKIFSLKGMPGKTLLYDKKIKQLAVFNNYLTEAAGMWEKLYAKTKHSIAKTNDICSECTNYIQTIKTWKNNFPSPFLEIYLARIEIILHSQACDLKEMAKPIKKLQNLVEKHPFLKSKGLLLEINYNYALYYRNTKQLISAKRYIQECFQYCDYKSFDKFMVQELNFDLRIKNQEYKSAQKILLEIHASPQYQFLNEADKSAWAIREAYLFFIYRTANQTEPIKLLPTFKNGLDIKGFLHKTKKSNKDKYGYNIMLLIIRLLLYIIKGTKDIEDEGNNLRIYYHRYMKGINNQRTVVFFKYLGKSAIEAFDKEKIEINKTKMIAKFTNLQESYDNAELIPYERLSKMVEELLQEKLIDIY